MIGPRGVDRWIPLFGALLLFCTCATSTARPGTGDISFRLTWTGTADLDLYVTSPLDERVDFLNRKAESGGLLDFDCNAVQSWFCPPDAECEVRNGVVCPEPMENIYWPRSTAPHGAYLYWVVVANEEGLSETDRYRVDVRLGETVVEQHGGPVSELRNLDHISVFEYPPKDEND